MKKFLIVTSAGLFFLACACSVSGRAADELHIGVRLTTGEHSKDSSSQTTTITGQRTLSSYEPSGQQHDFCRYYRGTDKAITATWETERWVTREEFNHCFTGRNHHPTRVARAGSRSAPGSDSTIK
jgi:hypothetical protein